MNKYDHGRLGKCPFNGDGALVDIQPRIVLVFVLLLMALIPPCVHFFIKGTTSIHVPTVYLSAKDCHAT